MTHSLRHVLTHSMKTGMLRYAKQHPECMEEMLILAVSDETPYNWRAAWLLCDVVKPKDPVALRYTPQLLQKLTSAPDGHSRELLKVLSRLQLSEEQQWQLYETCTAIWKDIRRQGSLRWHALRYIIRMAKQYPELKEEFEFLTESRHIDCMTHGARKSVMMMLSEMKHK